MPTHHNQRLKPLCIAAMLFATIFGTRAHLRADDVRPGSLQIRTTLASSSQDGHPAVGAADGDRFATSDGKLWKGAAGVKHWEWRADFGDVKEIGTILQVLGDHETYLAA